MYRDRERERERERDKPEERVSIPREISGL
jgi:hypothetical protein